MAKETKFALLIGLAFIVAFGFILARQDADSRNRQQDLPAPVTPVQGQDAADAGSGSTFRPGDSPERLTHMLGGGQTPAGAGAPTVDAGSTSDPAGSPRVVEINGISDQAHPGGQPPAVGGPPLPPPPAPQVWYSIQAGDSLYRIAGRHYGEANAGKWELIRQANATRIPSPQALRPGVRILIPPLPGQAVPVATATTPQVAPVPAPPAIPAVPVAPTVVAVRTYQVQVGDTLSSIAAKFLGSSSRFQQIVDWNRDQIPNANAIRPGMKLKVGPAAGGPPPVPALPVAPPPDSPLILGQRPGGVLAGAAAADALEPGYVPIPDAAPAPVPTPVVAVAAADQRYLVQPGETLSGIAGAKLGSSARWEALLGWNRDVLTDARALRPGMRLRLSPPSAASAASVSPARRPSTGAMLMSVPSEPTAEVGEIVG
jgi:nucleoid-associated protein YgaU